MDDFSLAIFDGEVDTFSDWGLMLETVSIPLPTPQIVSVQIPGMNGNLDLSEALSGYVNYNTRLITLTFSVQQSFDDWAIFVSRIANYLHGRKRKVVLDTDPNFYYYGRFSVDISKTDEVMCSIVITGIVDPYKYELETQQIAQIVSGSYSLIIYGAQMPVVPTINSTSIMTVTFGGVVYNLIVGDNTIPEVCLIDGVNTLLFTGTGTVTVTFLRGTF